jgi:hypothetical protein
MFLMPYLQPYPWSHHSLHRGTNIPRSGSPPTKPPAPTPPSQNYNLPEAYGTDIRTDPHTTGSDLVTQKWQGGGEGKVWQARET